MSSVYFTQPRGSTGLTLMMPRSPGGRFLCRAQFTQCVFLSTTWSRKVDSEERQTEAVLSVAFSRSVVWCASQCYYSPLLLREWLRFMPPPEKKRPSIAPEDVTPDTPERTIVCAKVLCLKNGNVNEYSTDTIFYNLL